MRPLRSSIMLLLVLLTACSALKPLHDTKPANPQEAVQQALDEVNIGLAAASEQLTQAWKDGAVSQTDFTDWRHDLNQVRDARDKAGIFLKVGDITSAAGQAKAAQELLDVVKKRLLARKKVELYYEVLT